jgi:hypothetical protein
VAKEKTVFIQNTGDHGVKVHSADEKLVKRFEIVKVDAFTGRQISAGYTPITEAEYDVLSKESKLFSHMLASGVLVKHDSLPEDVMTPHEALREAKKEAAEYEKLLAESDAENKKLSEELEALKKRLADAKTQK